MTTEIVFFDTIRELTESELQDSLKSFYPPPTGLHEARWAKHHSDPQLTVGFFTWNTIQDHHNFATSSRFQAVGAFVAPRIRSPLKIIHVHFKQGLPSFKSTSTLEIITLKRQDGAAQWELDVIHQAIEPFTNGASKKGLSAAFYGVVHEDPKQLVFLFDWESPKARDTAQADETWSKFLESISPADKELHLLTLYPSKE